MMQPELSRRAPSGADPHSSLVSETRPTPSQAVDIQAVADVPASVSATVEPANVDDWEVVEANAEYLTDQMLNQVRCRSLQAAVHATNSDL